jgi:hypothetical protein
MENYKERIAQLEKELAEERSKNQNIKALEEALEKKKIEDARREMLVGASILASVDSGEWPLDRLRAILDQKKPGA